MNKKLLLLLSLISVLSYPASFAKKYPQAHRRDNTDNFSSQHDQKSNTWKISDNGKEFTINVDDLTANCAVDSDEIVRRLQAGEDISSIVIIGPAGSGAAAGGAIGGAIGGTIGGIIAGVAGPVTIGIVVGVGGIYLLQDFMRNKKGSGGNGKKPKKNNQEDPEKPEDPEKDKDLHPYGIFEKNPKHHKNALDGIGKEPKRPQETLDTTIPVKDGLKRRVGIEDGKFVEYKAHRPGKFHGYVVESFNDLSQESRNALIKSGLVSTSGKILKK